MRLNDFTKQKVALGRFMLNCSIFGALIVMTLVVCEIAIRSLLPNPYKYKHERLSAKSDDIATLILGSSHGYYGIRPQVFGDSAFNLANVSQIFRYDNQLLRNYPFANLKTVILPLSYASFTDYDFAETDYWSFAANYKIYMDVNFHGDLSRYNFELSRPALFSQKLRALMDGKQLSCDSLGFGKDFSKGKSWGWKESGLKAAQRHTGKDFSAVDDNVAYLSAIASYCRERDIQLVLVTMPALESYRDNLNPGQYKMVTHLADSLARRYDFTYLNMIDDPRFVESDFYDADHFNLLGAEKFTKILRDTIAN
ncbi:MAG: hypothetical protein J1E63_07920 [Muribaculaceae bacterium]|nr:hypothetical protein [Muribaculaceae bacterium]